MYKDLILARGLLCRGTNPHLLSATSLLSVLLRCSAIGCKKLCHILIRLLEHFALDSSYEGRCRVPYRSPLYAVSKDLPTFCVLCGTGLYKPLGLVCWKSSSVFAMSPLHSITLHLGISLSRFTKNGVQL